MKYYIFILFLWGCNKETIQPSQPIQVCKVCTENVHYVQYNVSSQDYVASIITYCDDKWISVDGKTWGKSGTNNGISWKETHTISCK